MQVEPIAGRARPASERTSLSRRLWGFDWADHLPWRIGDVDVTPSTLAGALPFVEEHYPAIFGADGQADRFLADPMTPAKRRFCEEMDVMLVARDGQQVGVLMGHPTDWSTYYVRTLAILPEARNAHVGTTIADRLAAPLRDAGVERLEAEISPGNLPLLRAVITLGWVVTATVNSERWGSMLRLTKFLREDAEATFVRQFCGMHVKPRALP